MTTTEPTTEELAESAVRAYCRLVGLRVSLLRNDAMADWKPIFVSPMTPPVPCFFKTWSDALTALGAPKMDVGKESL